MIVNGKCKELLTTVADIAFVRSLEFDLICSKETHGSLKVRPARANFTKRGSTAKLAAVG